MPSASLFISTFKVPIFRQEKVLLERSLSSVHKCLLFLLEAKFKLTGRFFILKEYQSATRRSPFADNKKVGWWNFSKKTILQNIQKLRWMVFLSQDSELTWENVETSLLCLNAELPSPDRDLSPSKPKEIVVNAGCHWEQNLYAHT